MRVLVACEFSGRVRDAFRERGHEAISCDLVPSMREGPHIQGDVREHLAGWDLIIAFPPCTALCVSGAWRYAGSPEQAGAIEFVKTIWEAPCERLCIENPVGALSTQWAKPTQYIQPWQFGHGEVKKTCLWLRGLPRLRPTDMRPGREPRVYRSHGGTNGWKRSLTYQGVADAMASQWG